MATVNQQVESVLVEQFVCAIEAAMERQGITPSELARNAGIGRPYLYRVLGREQSPSLDWIEKVAKTLGLSINLKISGGKSQTPIARCP